MNRNEKPQWLMVLLVLAALIFLGPPALALLAGVVGVAIGLAAISLKLGVIALGVYAVVLLFRALFGKERATTPRIDHEAALARDDEELRRLDAELASVMATQKPL
jgi:membrane protein implicated in regulation of membrane protease activity